MTWNFRRGERDGDEPARYVDFDWDYDCETGFHDRTPQPIGRLTDDLIDDLLDRADTERKGEP